MDAFCFQAIDCQVFRSPTTGVESVELACLRVPVDGEQVATDAVHHRFGHAENRVRRNAGVDGGSALLQDACAGLGGLHVAGGHDAVGRNHHGAAVGAVF